MRGSEHACGYRGSTICSCSCSNVCVSRYDRCHGQQCGAAHARKRAAKARRAPYEPRQVGDPLNLGPAILHPAVRRHDV